MLGTCTSTSGQRRSVQQDEQTGAGSGCALPCRRDPDLWFAETPADLERAKALCGECPIKAECLAGARAREEPWGVWGGEIFERGSVVARKRPRGRPRKHPVADATVGNAGGDAERVA
jgi:WhiB family redox-sensing transcriptional regulator